MNKINSMTIIIVVFLIIAIFTKESKDEIPQKALENNTVILAFGDSLTYGFGASKEFSYPSIMQKNTGLKVINAGVNGETSLEGLARLPKFLEQNPDLVILCHGANDIIQNLSKEKLKENLFQMINLIKDNGAEVLLVSVPNVNIIGFANLSIYNELANENNLLIEDNVIRHIELKRSLKNDFIHPNKKGYKIMANSFIKLLKEKKVIP